MDSLFGGPNRKINLLVLAPTRELTMQNQIQEKADKFGRAAGYLSAYGVGLVCLYKVRKLRVLCLGAAKRPVKSYGECYCAGGNSREVE